MNRGVGRYLAAGLGLSALAAGSGEVAAQSALPPTVYSQYVVQSCPARAWSGDYRWQNCIAEFPAIPTRKYLRVTNGSCNMIFQHNSGAIARFYLAYVPTSQLSISLDTRSPPVSAEKFNFVTSPFQVSQPAESVGGVVVMQSQTTLPGTAFIPGGTRPVIVATMNNRGYKGVIELFCTLVGDIAG